MLELLENPCDERFIRSRIVTCDGKSIYFNHPNNRKKQLNRDGQVVELVAKRDRFLQKSALLCDWWNFDGGVINFKLVSNGRIIDTDFYCAQFDRMYVALTE